MDNHDTCLKIHELDTGAKPSTISFYYEFNKYDEQPPQSQNQMVFIQE